MPKSRDYYTTSQAGRLLGVSDDTIRRWVAERRIEAETTPGGQMRIAAAEIRRVRAEGKLLPRAAPATMRLRPGSEAARLAEQLEAEKLRLRLERMRMQREEAEARLRAEEARQRREQEEARRRQQELEQLQEAARRDQWQRQQWLDRAARRFADLPPEPRLAAMEVFERRLSALNPLPGDEFLNRLLEAVEQAARWPLRVAEQDRRLLERLLGEHGELARDSRYSALRDQALTAMHEALRQLELDAPAPVREAVARRALAPVLERYQLQKLAEELGERLEGALRRAGATGGEREQALEAWRARSAAASNETELRALAAGIEAEILARVRDRQQAEKAARQREAEEAAARRRESDLRSLARILLGDLVPRVLRQLEGEGEIEFDGDWDFHETCRAIQTRLEEAVFELLRQGAEPAEAGTQKRVEALILEAVEEIVEDVDDDDDLVD